MIPCYCWPDRASKGSLEGPIGPPRYLLPHLVATLITPEEKVNEVLYCKILHLAVGIVHNKSCAAIGFKEKILLWFAVANGYNI